MPSARRLRLFLLAILAVVITILFFTSQFQDPEDRAARNIDGFYRKTMDAMDGKRADQAILGGKGGKKGQSVPPKPVDTDKDGDIDEDDAQLAKEMSERLKAAEQKAKDLANAKAPLKPDAPHEVIGVGSSADGQKKNAKGGPKTTEEPEESEEDHQIETTLNEILKKSPVIIFSKTHCPYSKRAKGLLLEKYSIDPAPYVVELDQHPLGPKLQERLGIMTGRKTVPNIMVNGKSVGGGDEIAELDTRKTLIDKFKSMGGKRLAMKERFVHSNKL